MKPSRIKKRVNVTIETIMEPQFERDDDIIEIEQSGGDITPPRRSSIIGNQEKRSPKIKKIVVRDSFDKVL